MSALGLVTNWTHLAYTQRTSYSSPYTEKYENSSFESGCLSPSTLSRKGGLLSWKKADRGAQADYNGSRDLETTVSSTVCLQGCTATFLN